MHYGVDWNKYTPTSSGSISITNGTGRTLTLGTQRMRIAILQNDPGNAGTFTVGGPSAALNGANGVILAIGASITVWSDDGFRIGIFNNGAGAQTLRFIMFL